MVRIDMPIGVFSSWKWTATILVYIYVISDDNALGLVPFLFGDVHPSSRGYHLELSPFYPATHSAAAGWNFKDVDGQLIVEEGGAIQLKCTILRQPPASNLTASDIMISRNNELVPESSVRALNNQTAMLILPAVGLNESRTFHCFLPTYRHVYHHIPWGSYYVSVGRKPSTPFLAKCVIENWKYLNCTWGPDQYKQHNHTNIGLTTSLMYWRVTNSSDWHICEDKDRNLVRHFSESCVVNLTTSVNVLKDEFQIKFLAGNVLGFAESKIYSVDLKSIVVPNPVVFRKRRKLNSSNILLRWRFPVPASYQETLLNTTVIYTIQCESRSRLEGAPLGHTIWNVTTSEGMLPVRMAPFATYNLSVVSYITQDGPPSTPTTIHIQTPPTVPGRNPRVSKAVTLFQQNNGSRQIIVYWQSLATHNFNGPGMNYVVIARPISSHGVNIERSTKESYAALEIPTNGTYNITVISRNDVGESASEADFLTVVGERRIGESSTSEVIVEGDGNAAFLHWDNALFVADCTIYWCDKYSINGICKGNMNWTTLLTDISEYELELHEKYENYRFGISVSNGGTNSYIRMAHHNYYKRGVPAPPFEPILSFTNFEYREVKLKWKFPMPTRRENLAYAMVFVVQYCVIGETDRECKGSPSIISVASSQRSTVLKYLLPGTRYKVVLFSKSRLGIPSTRLVLYTKTPDVWVSVGSIIGVFAASLVAFFLAVIGIVFSIRMCKRTWVKLVSGVKITVPEQTRRQMPAEEIPKDGEGKAGRSPPDLPARHCSFTNIHESKEKYTNTLYSRYFLNTKQSMNSKNACDESCIYPHSPLLGCRNMENLLAEDCETKITFPSTDTSAYISEAAMMTTQTQCIDNNIKKPWTHVVASVVVSRDYLQYCQTMGYEMCPISEGGKYVSDMSCVVSAPVPVAKNCPVNDMGGYITSEDIRLSS